MKKISTESTRAFVAQSDPGTATSPHRLPKKFGMDKGVHPGSIPSRTLVTNLDFDVTEDCNLGCLYCFKGEMYSRHMSLDAMKRALDWLLAASGSVDKVNCNFMGGEPTMRFKVIKEFVPWARRRGSSKGKLVSFSMTTNLTLFTDEIRSFVDQYGFGVLMSIDGSPEVQDGQRPAKNGKPLSQVVEKWAKSLLKTRPGSTARATLHPLNVSTMADSFEYLQSIGFSEVAISASDYGSWRENHFVALEAELKKIEESTYKGLCEGGSFIPSSYRFYIDKLIKHRQSGNSDQIEWSNQPCGAGKGYMMVDYTGDIWPCHRFDGADTDVGASGAFRLGNVFSDGFNDALQGAFIDFDHTTMHKDICNTCPTNPVCGGYCPAANLSDTGSIYTPHDTFCTWTQMWYASANRLYKRCACRGSDGVLSKMLALCENTSGTGEK